jgi:hypothetical protein
VSGKDQLIFRGDLEVSRKRKKTKQVKKKVKLKVIDEKFMQIE